MNTEKLLQVLLQIEGVHTVVIVGRDGFVIDAACEPDRPEADAVAANISTGFHAFEIIGQELLQADLDHVTVEYPTGLIIMSRIDHNAVLAVVTDPDANLGYVRLQIKKKANDLKKFL